MLSVASGWNASLGMLVHSLCRCRKWWVMSIQDRLFALSREEQQALLVLSLEQRSLAAIRQAGRIAALCCSRPATLDGSLLFEAGDSGGHWQTRGPLPPGQVR
jgi:hypothetical protein